MNNPRTTIRLTAVSVLLVGIAFIQEPGLLVADTKLDLALDPAGFLSRALHLWDAQSAFGQLQNQAYGYLWPMGPFFLLGDLLDVPGWVVQRLWLALVLVVAFLGTAKVARALGVRSDVACIVAGVAFALSPRMLTTLGPISIEAWPGALAPWVLLPLIHGAARGSPLRAAALSALAVAMVGGVNAAATLAVLPLGALWLLTRTRGPRRRSLLLWWPLLTLLGTLWWLVPLLVMGAYSPPFLDYIESAANTTFPTTLFDALRGTANWVPYVDQEARAGNDLIRGSTLVINSGLLLALGLGGLLRRGNPHRLFLSLSLVLGLFLVTVGHLGSVHGWLAADAQSLLDGVLAPLRNVHKFDPVVRLPLVLGMALLIDGLLAALEGGRDEDDKSRSVEHAARRLNAVVLVGAAVVALVGASLPALVGRIPPAGAFGAVPDYWTHAADWLDGRPGTTLLVPGSSFGEYVWGAPHDEQFQSLADSPWAVRNAVPLTPAGSIRMLDAVEARLAQGVGSPGLAGFLGRAGVGHLVVRNDLERSSDIPDPVLVHQALAGSRGLERVAAFGPDIGGEAHLSDEDGSRILVNGGWQNEYPAVEVYEVTGEPSYAVTGSDPPVVVGGPEDLLDLTDLGLLGDAPTLLATDAGPDLDPSTPLVLTDGLRATERHFGRVHDGRSQTLEPDSPLRMSKPTRDYLPADADRWSTTARVDGARLSASSSMSDANAFGTVSPGNLPYAAVDGHPETAWVSNNVDEQAWWRIDFDAARTVEEVTLTAGPDREVVRLLTSSGSGDPVTVDAGDTRTIPVPEGATSWLRVEDASGREGRRMALTRVSVPGVEPTRSLVLPALPEGWGSPDTIVLRAVGDGRSGCVVVDAAVRCVPGRDVTGEEPLGFRRTVTLPAAETYDADLRVRARPGNPLLAALLEEQPIGISASSTGSPDVRASALAAIDGDRGTTWTASLRDLRPELRLSWLGKRDVTGLRLRVPADTAARLPERLTLTWPRGRRQVTLDEDGRVTFPRFRSDRLTLRVEDAEPATSLDFDSQASPVPVGIGALRVRGMPFEPVRLPDRPVRYPCGSGPTVVVDGLPVETSVTARPAEVYAGETITARLCGDSTLGLQAGANQVDVLASGTFTPTSLVLTTPGSSTTSAVAVASDRPDPVTRTLDPTGGGDVVVTRENTNPGWTATQAGRGTLEPVVVDGWRQAWRLADPEEPVAVTFAPDRTSRLGLLAGAVTLLALVLLVVVLSRRHRAGARTTPPLGAARLPGPVLAVVALGVGGLLAGWLGAAVALAGFLAAVAVRRRAPELGPYLAAAALVPAVGAYAVRPWGADAGWAGALAWPHYLVLFSCVLPLGWLAERPAGRPRFFSRIPGRSTSR